VAAGNVGPAASSTEGARQVIAVEQQLTPGDPTAVALGRTVVCDALTPGCPALVDDAVLTVSELVTNAIAAAREQVCLTVEVRDGLARIAVYDDGPGDPVACPSSPDRPHGRGLSIVEILAARWGVSKQHPGKWVWAEFPLRAA
jgi:anti-sigma regulatory factor (Ser/Thr protein kinase)